MEDYAPSTKTIMTKTTARKAERRSTFENTWLGLSDRCPERRMAPSPPRAMMRMRERGGAPSGEDDGLVAVRRGL